MSDNPNLRAAALLTAAMAFFSLSDVIVKALSARYPVGEIAFTRGLFVCGWLAVWIVLNREPLVMAVRRPAVLVRGLLEMTLALCHFTALSRLPLAEATALLFVFPILLTVLGAVVLKERVGMPRWTAVAVGMLGVLVILQPGTAAFSVDALFGLTAATALAVRDLVTRSIPRATGSGSIALAAAVFVMLGGLVTGDPASWRMPTIADFLLMVTGGLVSTTAFVLLVTGTRIGDMSFAAPFRFIGVPLAFFFGWLIWGVAPGISLSLGSLLIVGAGLVIALRERRASRPLVRVAPTASKTGDA